MAKSLSRFQVDILGANPEEVTISELSDFLRALEQAVASASETYDERIKLRLVDVATGSDRLTLAAPSEALPHIAVITAALKNGSFDQLPRPTHQALSEMSKVTKRNNWGFRFVGNKRLSIESVEFDVGQEVPAPVIRKVKGVTSIMARCMRVGGAVTPRAELRVHNRQVLLHVDISEKLAKELGNRLYDDVVLSGEATWDPDTWEVVEFSVSAIAPYEQTPVDVSFQQLAHVAGTAWDGIDADSFVQEQRGES